MVKNLCLLFHDITTVQIDRHGSLSDWIHKALNEKYWCRLLDQLLHPATPVPDHSADWGPLPSWWACRAAAGPSPTEDTSDSDYEIATADNDEQPRILPQPQAPQQSNAAEIPYESK
jgi:hypothetical protein